MRRTNKMAVLTSCGNDIIADFRPILFPDFFNFCSVVCACRPIECAEWNSTFSWGASGTLRGDTKQCFLILPWEDDMLDRG